MNDDWKPCWRCDEPIPEEQLPPKPSLEQLKRFRQLLAPFESTNPVRAYRVTEWRPNQLAVEVARQIDLWDRDLFIEAEEDHDPRLHWLRACLAKARELALGIVRETPFTYQLDEPVVCATRELNRATTYRERPDGIAPSGSLPQTDGDALPTETVALLSPDSVEEFKDLLNRALCQTETRAIWDGHHADDPTDFHARARSRFEKCDEERAWRAVWNSDAARHHDEVLRHAVLAAAARAATPNAPSLADAARAAWDAVSRVRELLGLKKFGPPVFLGPVPTDVAEVLTRMGVEDCSRVLPGWLFDNP